MAATRTILIGTVVNVFVSCLGFASPIISVQPPNTVLTPGQSAALAVAVDNVDDLFAFQFDLQFNPAVLTLTAVTEGSFLRNEGETLFLPGIIDNELGQVTFVSGTLLGDQPGVSGSGDLAVFEFTSQAEVSEFTSLTGLGVSPVVPANVLLLDSSLSSIPIEALGSATVSVIPEPSSGLLLLLLIGLLGVRYLGRIPAYLRGSRTKRVVPAPLSLQPKGPD